MPRSVAGIRRMEPELAEYITDARVIVGFRNVLTHNYAGVNPSPHRHSRSTGRMMQVGPPPPLRYSERSRP